MIHQTSCVGGLVCHRASGGGEAAGFMLHSSSLVSPPAQLVQFPVQQLVTAASGTGFAGDQVESDSWTRVSFWNTRDEQLSLVWSPGFKLDLLPF